jgi:hypothetical protein
MRESAYKKALASKEKKDHLLQDIAFHLGLFLKVQEDEELVEKEMQTYAGKEKK